MFHPIDDCEHSLLYLPGTGITSQETAISGSFQQNLAGVCNSVCVWWLIMGWIPSWGSLWIVHPFVSFDAHSQLLDGVQGPPKEELEKVPKELKRSATL